MSALRDEEEARHWGEVDVMALSPTQRFAEFLATRGRRLTEHSAHVVEVAFALPGTFTWEEVGEQLHGNVSRATVFRTLTLLLEQT